MCGIAGAVFWDDSPGGRDALHAVTAMTDALAHRGPDGQHVIECPPAAAPGSGGPRAVFGHRRLAIIDLTARGSQPMTSACEPIVLSYNGEIYNFRDVRRQLQSFGRRFRSDSDTEVILQGYEQWGASVVDRLRGMFAFAIWDGRDGRLLLARDRLGIKPLYVHRTDRALLFASEVRALLASGLVPRRLDLTALDQFLAYQTVPPPRTLVAHVELLPPGQLTIASARGEPMTCTYWDLLACTDERGPGTTRLADARDHTRQLLAESVGLHLVGDVPVAVFLSGGIDSSAVAALVKRTGSTPRTFAVTCPGTAFDEARYARGAARHCGADHTEIALDVGDIAGHLREAVASIDHPSGDGVNTFIVSHAVRQAGVKVALSGLGGDEFFGGYPSFERMARLAWYAGIWRRSPNVVRGAAGAVVRAVGGGSVASSKAAAILESDGSLPRAFSVLRQLFSREQRHALLRSPFHGIADAASDPYVTLLEDAAARRPDLDTMALVSYAEARTYMHDVLLRDTDQMSMRHGLEVRVPLLDHALVEHLMRLPSSLKLGPGGPKPLLLASLGEALPSECTHRPKQGFVLPFDLWMRGTLRTFCADHLGPDSMLAREVLQPEAVQHIWTSYLSGGREATWSRPWALVALDAWMQATGVRV